MCVHDPGAMSVEKQAVVKSEFSPDGGLKLTIKRQKTTAEDPSCKPEWVTESRGTGLGKLVIKRKSLGSAVSQSAKTTSTGSHADRQTEQRPVLRLSITSSAGTDGSLHAQVKSCSALSSTSCEASSVVEDGPSGSELSPCSCPLQQSPKDSGIDMSSPPHDDAAVGAEPSSAAAMWIATDSHVGDSSAADMEKMTVSCLEKLETNVANFVDVGNCSSKTLWPAAKSHSSEGRARKIQSTLRSQGERSVLKSLTTGTSQKFVNPLAKSYRVGRYQHMLPVHRIRSEANVARRSSLEESPTYNMITSRSSLSSSLPRVKTKLKLLSNNMYAPVFDQEMKRTTNRHDADENIKRLNVKKSCGEVVECKRNQHSSKSSSSSAFENLQVKLCFGNKRRHNGRGSGNEPVQKLPKLKFVVKSESSLSVPSIEQRLEDDSVTAEENVPRPTRRKLKQREARKTKVRSCNSLPDVNRSSANQSSPSVTADISSCHAKQKRIEAEQVADMEAPGKKSEVDSFAEQLSNHSPQLTDSQHFVTEDCAETKAVSTVQSIQCGAASVADESVSTAEPTRRKLRQREAGKAKVCSCSASADSLPDVGRSSANDSSLSMTADISSRHTKHKSTGTEAEQVADQEALENKSEEDSFAKQLFIYPPQLSNSQHSVTKACIETTAVSTVQSVDCDAVAADDESVSTAEPIRRKLKLCDTGRVIVHGCSTSADLFPDVDHSSANYLSQSMTGDISSHHAKHKSTGTEAEQVADQEAPEKESEVDSFAKQLSIHPLQLSDLQHSVTEECTETIAVRTVQSMDCDAAADGYVSTAVMTSSALCTDELCASQSSTYDTLNKALATAVQLETGKSESALSDQTKSSPLPPDCNGAVANHAVSVDIDSEKHYSEGSGFRSEIELGNLNENDSHDAGSGVEELPLPDNSACIAVEEMPTVPEHASTSDCNAACDEVSVLASGETDVTITSMPADDILTQDTFTDQSEKSDVDAIAAFDESNAPCTVEPSIAVRDNTVVPSLSSPLLVNDDSAVQNTACFDLPPCSNDGNEADNSHLSSASAVIMEDPSLCATDSGDTSIDVVNTSTVCAVDSVELNRQATTECQQDLRQEAVDTEELHEKDPNFEALGLASDTDCEPGNSCEQLVSDFACLFYVQSHPPAPCYSKEPTEPTVANSASSNGYLAAFAQFVNNVSVKKRSKRLKDVCKTDGDSELADEITPRPVCSETSVQQKAIPSQRRHRSVSSEKQTARKNRLPHHAADGGTTSTAKCVSAKETSSTVNSECLQRLTPAEDENPTPTLCGEELTNIVTSVCKTDDNSESAREITPMSVGSETSVLQKAIPSQRQHRSLSLEKPTAGKKRLPHRAADSGTVSTAKCVSAKETCSSLHAECLQRLTPAGDERLTPSQQKALPSQRRHRSVSSEKQTARKNRLLHYAVDGGIASTAECVSAKETCSSLDAECLQRLTPAEDEHLTPVQQKALLFQRRHRSVSSGKRTAWKNRLPYHAANGGTITAECVSAKETCSSVNAESLQRLMPAEDVHPTPTISREEVTNIVTSHCRLVSLRHRICQLVESLLPDVQFPSGLRRDSASVDRFVQDITDILSDGEAHTHDFQRCSDPQVALHRMPDQSLQSLQQQVLRLLSLLLPGTDLSDISCDSLDVFLEVVTSVNRPLPGSSFTASQPDVLLDQEASMQSVNTFYQQVRSSSDTRQTGTSFSPSESHMSPPLSTSYSMPMMPSSLLQINSPSGPAASGKRSIRRQVKDCLMFLDRDLT